MTLSISLGGLALLNRAYGNGHYYKSLENTIRFGADFDRNKLLSFDGKQQTEILK